MRTLPGDRWSCQSCGECCHGFELGPIAPDMVEALEARGLEELWPPAASGWMEHRPDGAYLRHRDGACVFLQPDQRCFLHARFGASAKPAFCQIFPIRLSEGPSGRVATVRPECSRYHRTHARGAPVADAVAALDGLPVPLTRLSAVNLLPGQPFPLSDWPALESTLLKQLSAPTGNPEQRVAGLRPLIGLPSTGNLAGYLRAAGALLYAIDAALASTGASAVRQREALAHVRARLASPPRRLDAQEEAYVGLVLRGHIAAGAFQTYGSLAAGLGRVLLETLMARHGTQPFGKQLAFWLRLTANPTLRPLLRAAAPALVDLTRFAPSQISEGPDQ